ncbi:MAG: sensor histidine kinase [Deltaproteobacteria bacterium]|nr:MAG: sensor histidine kinase [Deltaproteobacteria bacterium]
MVAAPSQLRRLSLPVALLAAAALAAAAVAAAGAHHTAAVARQFAARDRARLARQAAARIGATLADVRHRFGDPTARAAAEVDATTDPAALHARLAAWLTDDDRAAGIHLLVHDGRGRVLATDDLAPAAAAAAHAGHRHRVAAHGGGYGVCDACLRHGGDLTFDTPLASGLRLSVNIDAAALAAAALADLRGEGDAGDDSGAWVVGPDGAVLYAAGARPAPPRDGAATRAVAAVPGTGGAWSVVAAASDAALAAPVTAAAHRLGAIAAVAILLVAGAAAWLLWSERRHARQRVEMVRALAHQEQLATVGVMASSIAHEINNALMVVSASAALLLHRARDDEREDVAALERSIERIRRIAARLSRASRRDPGPPGPVSVAAAVDDAIETTAPALRAGPSVRVDLAAGVDCVAGYPGELAQVLVNLILNARAAMDGRTGAIVVRAAPAGGGVEIDVDDDGPGIAAGAMDHLFEPFFTTKPPGEGTGLGLWISRQLIERAGGTLHAANRDGGGARFTIWLPAYRAGAAERAPAGAAVGERLAGRCA